MEIKTCKTGGNNIPKIFIDEKEDNYFLNYGKLSIVLTGEEFKTLLEKVNKSALRDLENTYDIIKNTNRIIKNIKGVVSHFIARMYSQKLVDDSTVLFWKVHENFSEDKFITEFGGLVAAFTGSLKDMEEYINGEWDE